MGIKLEHWICIHDVSGMNIRGVPPLAPGISATGISAPIGSEVPVAEIPGAEGRTHYLWTIRRKIFHN